jgi:hypothetical protein
MRDPDLEPDYTDHFIEPEDGYSQIRRQVAFIIGVLFLLVAATAALVML